MARREGIGRCFVCERPIRVAPWVELEDAGGRLTIHFTCYTNGTSVRLQATPPPQIAPDAYNATLTRKVIHR